MRVVAIHQPNFFPWLGYFDKIIRSDIFVFLDDVQNPKKGGAWTNRVKVLSHGEERWLTAPLDRTFRGTRLINESAYSSGSDWRSQILNTLTIAYKHAPYFNESYELIEPLVKNPENNVAEYNLHAINILLKLLRIPLEKCVRSSDIPVGSKATDRLIEITNRLRGTTYLCGGGSSSYLDDLAFHRSGINLVYQNYLPSQYEQVDRQSFAPGLSIIDGLMNIGISRIRNLVKQNVEQSCF